MKRAIVVLTLSVAPLWTGLATAQNQATQNQAPQNQAGQTAPPVAGRAPLGVVTIDAVVTGWSAKRDLLGKTVMNDKKERIGKIDDMIITPSADSKTPSASFAIIGVGGFLGVGTKDVAIPTEQFKLQGTDVILPGATKDALKGMPPFVYQRKK